MENKRSVRRRYFIGGSDARVIMGDDEAALVRLWREKRGEVEPEDLSGNLIVQLGVVTEDLNRRWYEANTGQVITDIQKHVRHPTVRWIAATPDGRVQQRRRLRVEVHAALVLLGRGRHREVHAAAAAQHVGRGGQVAVLSVITGGGKWVEINACGPALPAPDHHRRAKVLALRGER